MPTARLRSLAVAVLGVGALLTAPAVPASAASPTPGAPGIGDSYFADYGNGGYDVSHYELRLTYQPATDQLSGTATLLARATQDLSQFNLDFALTVSSVRVNGLVAAFTKSGAHELVITPATPLANGQPMTVVVQYSGIPSSVRVNGFTNWTRTADGAVAVNEPEISWWWFPANDHPSDKATYEISVSVPDGNQVISNGRLLSSVSSAGRTRWTWRETKPMATYLAFIAMGRFEFGNSQSSTGLPVVTAYSKNLTQEVREAAMSQVERTAEILDWEISVFGPYPFDAMGGVVPAVPFRFALENQTRPVYGSRRFETDTGPYVVVHENAHMWFGDSVSVGDWRNIWLNEGFARYTEWLYSETQGEGTAQELFDFTYSRPDNDPLWTIRTADPGTANLFNLFGIYNRGAMTLHALRTRIGDTAFFTLLRTWVAQRQYGNGVIEDFMSLAEQISGQDLRGLFTAWLFTGAKPAATAANGVPTGLTATTQRPVREPASWNKINQSDPHEH